MANLLVQPGHAATTQADHLGLVVTHGAFGLPDNRLHGPQRVGFQFQHRQPAGSHRGAAVIQARELQAVLDQWHGAVERGYYGIGVAQIHCRAGGGVGNVHHRHVEQFLQAFAAMFAITGLDHGIVGPFKGQDPVHHRDGRQVALEVALHRFGAEPGCEADDFGTGCGHRTGLFGNGVGDGFGSVDVGDQNAHGQSSLTNGCCGRRRCTRR